MEPSKNITEGSVNNSTPIVVLRFSPPDIPFSIVEPTNVSAQLTKSNSLIILLTFSILTESSQGPNLNFAENNKISKNS